MCPFLCKKLIKRSTRQYGDENPASVGERHDGRSRVSSPCRFAGGKRHSRNRTQLTGHETLALLLQLVRLIRRLRLEDAYLAQVIDVNAVLRQRVGHLLKCAKLGHVTPPFVPRTRAIPIGRSGITLVSRHSRCSPCIVAGRPPLSSARRLWIHTFAIKFAAFDDERAGYEARWRYVDLSRDPSVLPTSAGVSERVGLVVDATLLSTLLARRHVASTQTRRIRQAVRTSRAVEGSIRLAPAFTPSRGVAVLAPVLASASPGSVARVFVMSGEHKIKYPSEYVKLNIGGSLHYTTIGTLQKHDTMLRAMFSGRMEVLTDSEGWILIDRCGKHFGTILNFLRDGSVPLPENTKEMAELLAEAKYYCISELAESCEQALLRKEREAEPICRVPLITSQKEEQLLISNTTKPVVKLLINRHNNKYSYTSTSDDNLLKNIELFDKMSLRFSGRVLFIKDVIGSSEICCWTFYGHGRKVAEVCCHSIVYTTDKKHTKVEFPEARIYEETLNILLYEHRNGPDQELMQATSSRGVVPCTSDEEEGERSGLARLRSNKQNTN